MKRKPDAGRTALATTIGYDKRDQNCEKNCHKKNARTLKGRSNRLGAFVDAETLRGRVVRRSNDRTKRMSAPINLNKVKKRRNRASRKARADENFSGKFRARRRTPEGSSERRGSTISRNWKAHKREKHERETCKNIS